MYIRLCDADRERYGGPEWLNLEPDGLLDVPASQLAEWEREIGLSVMQIINDDRLSAHAVRGATWIALRMAKVDLPYADFDPLTLKARLLAHPPTTDAGKEPSPDGQPSPDFSAPAA